MTRILAPAKINLFLDIVGIRGDGYHEIETVFQTVSLYDEIDIEETRDGAPRIALEVAAGDGRRPELCPDGPGNIVWKAADLFLTEFGLDKRCRIRLAKRIPIQAGLGGGSSDAAAVLKGLQRIFLKGRRDRKAIRAKMRRIALRLGADVPFFLEGGCAKAWGVGEKLSSVGRAPKFWAVLVKPDVGLSTREVYRWFDDARVRPAKAGSKAKFTGKPARARLTYRPNLTKITSLIARKQPVGRWGQYLYNCFEDVVFAKHPQLERVKRALVSCGALNASLSGSGSAFFGLVPSKARGEEVRRRLGGFHGNVWVVHSVE